ncbi:MAG: hypothetical protein WCF85_09640 [Rhodospirillaceae bacterium]
MKLRKWNSLIGAAGKARLLALTAEQLKPATNILPRSNLLNKSTEKGILVPNDYFVTEDRKNV